MKKKDALQIIAPDRRIHTDELIDVVAKGFESSYFEFRDELRRAYLLHSHYDWNASRIGTLGGRIVTHYGVWGYRMRIGSARVRVGGIGAVVTDGDFRKRGLMARTIPPALDAMRDCGYDMTLLFGIRDFYHKFGYVRAWPYREHVVKVDDLPSESPVARPRKFLSFLREDVTAMYNRKHARTTGTAVRPTYLSNAHRRKTWLGHLWRDGHGRTSGYVMCSRRGEMLQCFEAAGDVEQALRVVATLARRWGYKKVKFAGLHYDDPLARRLRRGNCSVETHYRRSGGPMIRTLNLDAALRKMSGELSRRLKRSHLSTWRGKLLIADAREKVVLQVGRSGVRVPPAAKTRHAIRGGEEIAQLLIGTDEPEETVEAGRIRLTGDARDLVGVLFPNEYPFISWWDSF